MFAGRKIKVDLCANRDLFLVSAAVVLAAIIDLPGNCGLIREGLLYPLAELLVGHALLETR